MGKNSKPILSVLVDEDKKERFAELARRNKQSMGWLLNDCIDRMLAADSIEVYDTPKSTPFPSQPVDIEELVKIYVSTHLSTSYVKVNDVENLLKTYIDKLGIENLVRKYVNEMEQPSSPSPTTTDTTTKPSPTRKLTSKDDYPDWVSPDKRSHYRKLTGNPELLASVTKIIESSGNNDEIAKEVVALGFVNEKGGKLGDTAIYKLKSVLKVLNGAEANDN